MDFQSCGAIFDITATYRYSLWRVWSAAAPRVVFVMLNPSTADAQYNDPTIRRCIDFASTWGFGSVEVVNLFAYRTVHPTQLRQVDDPIGADNNLFLVQAVQRAARIVVAWGTHGTLLDRDREVLELLKRGHTCYCFGLTKDGHPKHPLYVRGDTRLVTYTLAASFQLQN
ncbi:MAG: DUF1643 domain-containing protein [Ktedonobacteraceae bacterium]